MSAGISGSRGFFVRDGGDPYGVASLAARLAPNTGLIIGHLFLQSTETDIMEKS